jgi:hypothetical protein
MFSEPNRKPPVLFISKRDQINNTFPNQLENRQFWYSERKIRIKEPATRYGCLKEKSESKNERFCERTDGFHSIIPPFFPPPTLVS